jgi:transposase
VLIDESGFMLQPLTRRTWAPRGHTPVMDAWDRHDRLTVISALALTPHRRRCDLYFKLLRHNAKAEDFFWFLIEVRREIGRPLVVVWDRLAAHRKAQRWFDELDFQWIEFEYFPAYCPDLDPVEHVWATTKWGRLANWPAPGLDALEARVADDLHNQAGNQRLLKNHFTWAGLELN